MATDQQLPDSPTAVASGHSVQRLVRHLVQFSGGVCSWAAAKRVVERHGTEGVVLLFSDTNMEDEDLYRFLGESASNVFGWEQCPPIQTLRELAAKIGEASIQPEGKSCRLVIIADGRTPWEVMRDHNMIAKPRVDMCSRELKRDLLDEWYESNCLDDHNRSETISYVGIDWTESHRIERLRELMPERKWEAPMTEAPYLTKAQMLDWLKSEGIQPPRLYAMGFPHNNCGGFCIKAGQAHFAHLLRMMPDRYRWHEAREEEMRQRVGDYSILRDRTGGTTKTLTLRQLRERIESQQEFDAFEWGGCGCAIDA